MKIEFPHTEWPPFLRAHTKKDSTYLHPFFFQWILHQTPPTLYSSIGMAHVQTFKT